MESQDRKKASGDTVNLTKTSATFPDKNVGASRTVTVNGIDQSAARTRRTTTS